MQICDYRIVVVMLLFLAPAFAGDGRGNGGIVLVCDPKLSGQPAIQLFDFYEGRELRGISPELGEGSLSFADKIALALSRLDRLDRERAGRYFSSVTHFQDEALFKRNVTLTPLSDAFPLFLPTKCRIEQAVNQQEPIFPQDKRYIVSTDLWERLDSDSRAGLILHEVVYRDAIHLGQTDSRATRAFIQVLTSHRLESMNHTEYENFLEGLHFNSDH